MNKTITFEVDDLQQNVLTFIVDNSVVEGAEFFSVSISPILGLFPVAVKNSTVTIFINDNDCK